MMDANTTHLTAQHALESALRDGPNPLCIDLYDRAAEGVLRSSNSTYMRHLPRADIAAIVQLVKELAGFDPTERRIQSGWFSLGGNGGKVHCCPQVDGEILIIHHSTSSR